MSKNVITKMLGGIQDLLFGIGTTVQERAGTDYSIERISLIKQLDDLASLKLLDVETPDAFYPMAILLGLAAKGDNLGGTFYHDSTIAQSTADDIDIVADSGSGPNGCWLRLAEPEPAGTVSVEKSWSFDSPAASNGVFYFGGFYNFGAIANDFNPFITFGASNSSYAAHIMFVTAAGASAGTDTVLQITGASITDEGVRTVIAETVTIPHDIALNTVFETDAKWLGTVTITKLSGPDLLCNYGFCNYWDNANTDFIVTSVEALWLCGANDANINIELIHHNSAGWTYNAGAIPTHATLASLQVDHNTEYQAVNNDNGAWKRTNLNQAIVGSSNAGTLFKVTTSVNKAFELGNLMLRITS